MDELLMDRRRVMMANSKPYIELEYIESTGAQWIDTGIIFDINNEYKTKVARIDNSNGVVFGARKVANFGVETNDNFNLFGYYQNYTGMFLDSWDRISTWVNDLNWHDVICSSKKIIVDNVSYGEGNKTANGIYSIYLFAVNLANSASIIAKLKVSNFKIYNGNNNVIQNLIPVIEKSTNEVCMYDTVTKKFFKNQGTGQFIAGPRK